MRGQKVENALVKLQPSMTRTLRGVREYGSYGVTELWSRGVMELWRSFLPIPRIYGVQILSFCCILLHFAGNLADLPDLLPSLGKACQFMFGILNL